MNRYTVPKLSDSLQLSPDSLVWNSVGPVYIDNFLADSSNHHPLTEVRAGYNQTSLFAHFTVFDHYVKSTRTEFQSDVWNDSCVEWFIKPKENKGYFNFEINAGGTLRVSYIEDPTRLPDNSLKKSTMLPATLGATIKIIPSLPTIVDPEIQIPVVWTIALEIPRSVLEYYIGPVGDLHAQIWRANFNKCADQTSHPHWATWNPISMKNFHNPKEFGMLVFE